MEGIFARGMGFARPDENIKTNRVFYQNKMDKVGKGGETNGKMDLFSRTQSWGPPLEKCNGK